MHEHLVARYTSAAGARAYRRKYEGSWTRRWSNRRELCAVRWALARAGTTGRVLDCPTGAGRLVPTLLTVATQVTAADLSPAMIEQAREALAPELAAGRVELLVAPATRLPFPDRAFDTVVCHRLLHHVVEPAERRAILAELARVAQRRVVLSFSDATTVKARLQRLRGVARRRAVLTPAALAGEAASVGLVADGTPRRLSTWFSLVAVAVFRVERPAP